MMINQSMDGAVRIFEIFWILKKYFQTVQYLHLEKNYRSTQKILDAATMVVKNNVDRAAKELYSVQGIGEKLGFHTNNG